MHLCNDNVSIPTAMDLADIVPQPVYGNDLDHRVIFGNQALAKFSGVNTVKDWLGKSPCDLYPEKIAKDLIKNREYVIQSGKKLHCEENIEDIATGEIKVFDVAIAPWRNDKGEIIGTCSVSVDITERKKQEAEIIRQKNQLEKKLQFQRNYLKSHGYSYTDTLRKLSNSITEVERRLRQLDVSAKVRTDLSDEFYALNEVQSELYTMYQKINSVVISAEENIKNFDQKQELPMRIESLVETEVGIANSCISAEFDVKVSYEMDEKSKQKLDVDHRKLQHILRTLFANYTKGINKESRKEDIHLSITAEDGYRDILNVTFEFKGPMPFIEVEENEIRAEHLVYKSQTRVAADKHDFACDVALAMHYADVLCGGREDLNEHLFEGPYFSFTLPFCKTEDDGKGKPHLFLVE